MPVATADDLTGFGLAGQLAALLGANPQALPGSGTVQGGAAILKTRNTELVPSAGNTAFIPPPDAKVMAPFFLTNQQATAAVIFVPVGHTLNGTLNGSIAALAQGKSAILYQYKPKFWATILSA